MQDKLQPPGKHLQHVRFHETSWLVDRLVRFMGTSLVLIPHAEDNGYAESAHYPVSQLWEMATASDVDATRIRSSAIPSTRNDSAKPRSSVGNNALNHHPSPPHAGTPTYQRMDIILQQTRIRLELPNASSKLER